MADEGKRARDAERYHNAAHRSCPKCNDWVGPLHEHHFVDYFQAAGGPWQCRWCHRELKSNRVECNCPQRKFAKEAWKKAWETEGQREYKETSDQSAPLTSDQA